MSLSLFYQELRRIRPHFNVRLNGEAIELIKDGVLFCPATAVAYSKSNKITTSVTKTLGMSVTEVNLVMDASDKHPGYLPEVRKELEEALGV